MDTLLLPNMDDATIDLSGIEPDYYPKLLTADSSYSDLRRLRFQQMSLYSEAKKKSDQFFLEWFQEINQQLLHDIEDFIQNSMGLSGKKNLFPDAYSNVIFPATVVLGLHQSDNLPTIDMIEQHIQLTHKEVSILRLKVNLNRKSQLLEILKDVKFHRNILIIVEQTELIEAFLLEILINALHHMLQGPQVENVMVLFCMSGSWKTINRLLPISVRNRMKPCVNIVKETKNLFKIIILRLVKGDGLPFLMQPSLIRAIDNDCHYIDLSITNLKYLYQSALFKHYLGISRLPLVSLPKKELVSLAKHQPDLISFLFSTAQLKKEAKAGNKLVTMSVIDTLEKNLIEIRKNHEFICIQLDYYLILLRDETGEMFPDDILDLYEEVFKYDDMGHSVELVNSIHNIRSYSQEGLMRRIKSIVDSYQKVPAGFEKFDVYRIFSDYAKKTPDLGSYKDFANNLTKELLKQAQYIKNPSSYGLFKAIYNDDVSLFSERTMPSTRFHFKRIAADRSNFTILLELIQSSQEDINLDVLYCDFKQKVEELEEKKIIPKPKKEKKVDTVSLKSRRSSKRVQKKGIQQEDESHPVEESEEAVSCQPKEGGLSDELLRAIFFDLIETFKQHGIIVTDNRRSRKDSLKKNAWL